MGEEKDNGEYAAYAKIVAAVKAKAAKTKMTGDQVSHEIAKRWARYQNRKFDCPAPEGPVDIRRPGLGAAPPHRDVSPAKGKLQARVKLPDPAFQSKADS